jgi:hypothetical protein
VELHALLGWRFSWSAFRTPWIAFLAALVPGVGLRAWFGPGIGELAGAVIFVAVYVGTWRAQGIDEADRAVLAAIRSRRPGIINP